MGDKEQTQIAAVIDIDREDGDGNGHFAMPLSLPTPTIQYKQRRRQIKAATATVPAATVPTVVSTTPPVTTIPAVILLPGARVLMWKQDPTVAEIGIRKAYLPGHVFSGPRDARIKMGAGTPVINPNNFGDMIETPGSDAFDIVHTFSVVRETLTMYQRARNNGTSPAPLPWQWNTPTDTAPLSVFHKAGNTMNAFYSRAERALKFFFFNKPGDPPTAPLIFTCRSLDIVAHETGHAVLDGLKPGWFGTAGNPPQTGALHESFGDLTAIFLTLSQMDQVEAVIAQTKANLHDKSFLSDLAEQFGLALGRPNGLRNADNDLTLSQVTNEVHSLSQVFTGAIYDILADIFRREQRTSIKDDAATLYETAQYVCSLLLRAIIAAPATAATFAHVANQMLNISLADGKPADYRTFIRNRFTVRGVLVAATPLALGAEEEGAALVEADHPSVYANIPSNLWGTCGTMQTAEFMGGEDALRAELEELAASLRAVKTNGNGNGHHGHEAGKKMGKEKNRASGVKAGR